MRPESTLVQVLQRQVYCEAITESLRVSSILSPCGEIVRLGDPDRFRTALFAKPEQREHLFALYAFNLEIAKIAPMVSEPMLGEIRLQWWREALDQIYSEGPVRQHEVTTPLAEAVRTTKLPRAPFDALIDQRANDLDPAFPDSDAALHDYIDATAGGLTALAAKALTPELNDDGMKVAQDVGFAVGAARYLMALPNLVKTGRKPLPMDMVDTLAEEGRKRLANAQAARAVIPKRAAPALLERTTAAHNLSSPSERSAFRERLAIFWIGMRGRW